MGLAGISFRVTKWGGFSTKLGMTFRTSNQSKSLVEAVKTWDFFVKLIFVKCGSLCLMCSVDLQNGLSP